MVVADFEGTTFSQRIQMVLSKPPLTSEAGSRVLNQIIEWETEFGEFGQAAASTLDPEGVRRWLTLLYATAVFNNGRDSLVAAFFIDEWINRGYAGVLGELAVSSRSAGLTGHHIADLWSRSGDDFGTFLEAALLHDVLKHVESYPQLLPEKGMLSVLTPAQ